MEDSFRHAGNEGGHRMPGPDRAGVCPWGIAYPVDGPPVKDGLTRWSETAYAGPKTGRARIAASE